MAEKLRFVNCGLRLDVAHAFRAAGHALRWDLRGISPSYDVPSTNEKLQRMPAEFVVVEPELGVRLDANLPLASVVALPVVALLSRAPSRAELQWLRRQGVTLAVGRPFSADEIRGALELLREIRATSVRWAEGTNLAELLTSVNQTSMQQGARRIVHVGASPAGAMRLALSARSWEQRIKEEALGRIYVGPSGIVAAEWPGLDGVPALAKMLSVDRPLLTTQSYLLEPPSDAFLGPTVHALAAARELLPRLASRPPSLQIDRRQHFIWSGEGDAVERDTDLCSHAPAGASGGETLVEPGAEPGLEPESDDQKTPVQVQAAVDRARPTSTAIGSVQRSAVPSSGIASRAWQRGRAADARIASVPASTRPSEARAGELASTAMGIAQVVAASEHGEVLAHAGSGGVDQAEAFAIATQAVLAELAPLATETGLGDLCGFGTSPEVGAAAACDGQFVIGARGVRAMDPKRALAHLRTCRARLQRGETFFE